MPNSNPSWIGRTFRGLWWLLDASRRAILNLLLLAFVVAIVWALLRGGPPALQPKTALVLDLAGSLAEQRAGSARASVLNQLQGQDIKQTRLRDVLAVLDAAAKDDQISHAVLLLDDFGGSGLASLRDVAAALDRFKASGKPVIAWGSDYDQRQYYLAAHASELWLHPMGSINVQGYGHLRSYYKDLFDKVGIQVEVVRAGKFKSFAEPYTASGPSPETTLAEDTLNNSLWASWTGGVETARKQTPGSVQAAIESLPGSLAAVSGDMAKWALERKWVDALKTRDELRAEMIKRGARDDEHKTFRQVSFGEYLARIKPQLSGDAVGVVVAEGSIGDGRAGPGSIGGLSTSQLIRQARDDEKIKAIVLRVDSPGGSAFGSELVRRELELTRAAGKPVVVSMGDVAASGGYWISLAADEMIADEATITGSIGVIAMLPTAQGAMDKLGINNAGHGTTWLATAFDPRRAMDPRFRELLQVSIDHAYREFTTRAATARKTTPEKIDAVAQGRVWTGKDALANNLVDRLGGFEDALKSAATRAKLPAGYRVQYIEAEPSRLQQLLQNFGLDAAIDGGLAALVGRPVDFNGALIALGLLPPVAAQMAGELGWLTELGARRLPYAAAVHCLCVAP